MISPRQTGLWVGGVKEIQDGRERERAREKETEEEIGRERNEPKAVEREG